MFYECYPLDKQRWLSHYEYQITFIKHFIILLYNKKSKKSTRISWYKINVISYQHLPVKGLGISAFREINLISTST